MKCTKEALEELIRERYGSVPKMARKIGKSEQTIYTCIGKSLVGSHMTTAMPIIAALDLDPFELIEGRLAFRSDRDLSFVNVPLYGSVSAGPLGESVPIDDMVPIPAEKHAQYPDAFLLRVSGKSMNRTFPDGMLVLVDPCSDIEHPGQPYVVYSTSEGATIKRAYPLDNGLELLPYSTDTTMKPIVYDYSSPDALEVSVVGRAVWGTYPLDWRFDANVR